MNKSDLEKAKLGTESMSAFFKDLQTDVYSTIVLEEFFKALYGITEDLSISGTSGQKGNQTIEQLSSSLHGTPNQSDQCGSIRIAEGNSGSDSSQNL